MSGEHVADDDGIVGLVPAAGLATRLGPGLGSKELLPVPDDRGELRPVCFDLLGQMASAGIRRVLVVLRLGKWDLPAALGSGRALGLDLAYRVLETSDSVPTSLASGLRFVGDRRVALGFPDIVYRPHRALARLVAHQRHTGADLALGLFPTDRADKADMVELSPSGEIVDFAIKEGRRDLEFTWGLAVWTSRFSRLLLDTVADPPRDLGRELFIGDVVARALDTGLELTGLPFPDGYFLDVGTPEDLALAREGRGRGPDPSP